ncbi:hypothetical protein Tco_0530043 [Tanacetum coccineum]
MQQFWYNIKKVKDSESYEFLFANKKCIVNAEVFRKILDICPRAEGEELIEVYDDEATLTFLIDLSYKGMFYKENVDYPELNWKDIAFQIDHRKEKLKFVRIGEDYQEYRLHIPDMMLNDKIKQSESYQMFIKYSTGQIPPKKSRGKGSHRKKTADTVEATVDISKESSPEPARKQTASRRVVKKKVTISVADNIIPDPDVALELGKSISLTKAAEEEVARQVHATHARIVTKFVLEPPRRRLMTSNNVTFIASFIPIIMENLQAGGEYEDKDEDFRRSPYKDKDTEDIRRYS